MPEKIMSAASEQPALLGSDDYCEWTETFFHLLETEQPIELPQKTYVGIN